MAKLSEKFLSRLKLDERPAYRLARQAGFDNPNNFYKITCGIATPQRGDPRILAIGELLGVPIDEIFQAEAEKLEATA